MISLWRATDPAAATPFNRKTNVGLHHLALQVDSFEALDAMHERLRAADGVRIEFAPDLLGGGPTKHMMFREPSGNRMELTAAESIATLAVVRRRDALHAAADPVVGSRAVQVAREPDACAFPVPCPRETEPPDRQDLSIGRREVML